MLYMYIGYALIQLPEALLSIYMHLKRNFDNNDTTDRPNEIIDIQMINRESSMKPQSDKSLDMDRDLPQCTMDKNNGGYLEVNPYIVNVVHKIEKNLETLGKRIDEMESKTSY